MIPRMTTVGSLKNYRYDLNRSNNTMSKAMNTILTGRAFNTYAEDPALATRCFQIRRSYMRAASQLSVNDSILSKYNQAWSALDTVSQDIYDSETFNDASFGSLIRAQNGPDASGRNALGQSLSAKAKSIVQTMNGRNGENYIFGGADTLNPPFTWGARKNSAYIDPSSYEGLTDAEKQQKYPQTFLYIKDDPNGGLTNNPDEALKGVTINPNADFTQPNSANNMWYLDADGNPTDNRADAAPALRANPDFVEDEEEREALIEEFKNTHDQDADGYAEALQSYTEKISKHYLTEDGVVTDDPALAGFIQNNPVYDSMTEYKYLKEDGTGTNIESEAEQALHYRGVPVDSMAPEDIEKMEYFMEETKYLDVGLGHKEENGEPISSTVFNSAIQGVYYLSGYGTESVEVTLDSGKTTTIEIPNNIVSIINRLGTILQRCSPKDGAYASEEDRAEAELLYKKFEQQKDLFIQRYAEQDSQTSFLRDNSSLLVETADSLAEDFLGMEDVDPADAITAYMYARYCYDTALKVGNSILSQSLMDYMNF